MYVQVIGIFEIPITLFRKGDVKEASAPRADLRYNGGLQGVSP